MLSTAVADGIPVGLAYSWASADAPIIIFSGNGMRPGAGDGRAAGPSGVQSRDPASTSAPCWSRRSRTSTAYGGNCAPSSRHRRPPRGGCTTRRRREARHRTPRRGSSLYLGLGPGELRCRIIAGEPEAYLTRPPRGRPARAGFCAAPRNAPKPLEGSSSR